MGVYYTCKYDNSIDQDIFVQLCGGSGSRSGCEYGINIQRSLNNLI